MPAKREPSTGEPVARRALDLLGTFDARHRKLTLSEMSRRSGLPVATAHRLAAVLSEWGALERGSDHRYEVGRRIWQLGLLAEVQMEIRQIAAPFLQDLFVSTREAVYLAIREGTSALYIDRLTGSAAPKLFAQLGTRLPLYATGVGKILLAHAPDLVVDDVLHHLRQFTPYTIADPESLLKELATVRQRGFARTREEIGFGSAAVAVPITHPDGTVEAALGIVTADLRKDLSRMVPALSVAALGISRNLPPRTSDHVA